MKTQAMPFDYQNASRQTRVALLVFVCSAWAWAAEPGYTDPAACRPCHTAIFDSYQKTGMGRSFSRFTAAPPKADFIHAASQRHYAIVERAGAAYLRRWQDGQVNVVEKRIDYAIGSGNHSITYLHRRADGKFLELPLSWYSENGGHWAMSPGYDRPNHPDFRREISDSCLFCHNGYPSEANGGLASGIDCQRCHGPGEAHARKLAPILNPKKLAPERQLDICMQCHLETTSRTLPHMIRRDHRRPFSYRPGEPLSAYVVFFDHPPGTAWEDKFEVNHAAYRLRKSACFLKSGGRMTCTSCHNPHEPSRDTDYTARCRACHAGSHEPATKDCARCHMPKRRPEDAVHTVMTDHLVQRKPAAGLTAPRAEDSRSYQGPVAQYYPEQPDALYLAVAQIKEFNNPKAAGSLRALLDRLMPPEAEFYFDLAEAYWRTGQLEDAVKMYAEAARRRENSPRIYNAWAETLMRQGKVDRAAALLEPVLKRFPNEPGLLNTVAVAYGQTGRIDDSLALLNRAIAADPDLPLTWINLGVSLEHKGDIAAAESAYRNALRLQPDLDRARQYLRKLAE